MVNRRDNNICSKVTTLAGTADYGENVEIAEKAIYRIVL
jgi:hypothetical protein